MIGPPPSRGRQTIARGRQTRFIVVRHGETQWNVASRIQGQRDSELTATGIAQALAHTHAGRRVAVVTHGGVLATLYRFVHGIPIAVPHKVAITNATYNALSVLERNWSVESWDDGAHLADTDPFDAA